jgi:hypothetical protein
MKRSNKVLLQREREVRDEFDLSASANLIAPLLSILLSVVLRENEMEQQTCYR